MANHAGSNPIFLSRLRLIMAATLRISRPFGDVNLTGDGGRCHRGITGVREKMRFAPAEEHQSV